MAATVTRGPQSGVSRIPQGVGVQARQFPMVLAWAAVGLVFVAAEAYTIVSWATSERFTRSGPGPTPLPTHMAITLTAMTIAGAIGTLAAIWFWLIKPWRRQGRITTDGIFLIVFASLYWQDPLSNWMQPWFTYNLHLMNMGSWLSELPGFSLPNAHRIGEPFLFVFPAYIWLVFTAVVVGCWIMGKVKARYPAMSKVGLVATCFAAFMVIDLIVEPVLLMSGLYVYPGPIKGLTLFYGHYFQFPLYEAPFWAGAWCAWTCVRFFKNDLGQTMAERGIEKVRTGEKRKTVLRVLAIAGISNLIFLGYNFGVQVFALHQQDFPEDIVERSYFYNGLCGPGTDYVCPGNDVPIAKEGSSYVTPEGKLVVPPGSKMGP